MRITIFAIFAIEAIRASLVKDGCPDQELGDKCMKAVEQEYYACNAGCQSQLCSADCAAEYSVNIRTCPCSDQHQDGCGSSTHPICTCKNPELDNEFFKQCSAEANQRFDDCTENCGTVIDCFDGCYLTLKEEMKECPCMEKCEYGCPCKTGFSCEPYITAMCQNFHSSDEITSSHIDFSYSISASGHNKEIVRKKKQNRHYTLPAKTNYKFLYGSGFSILNGEVYIFGGDQDSKKIAKINDCRIEDTGKKLITSFYKYHGSLVTQKENSEKIILCNGINSKCESFDGFSTVAIAETQNDHDWGCMAINEQGRPTIIAGHSSSVEILETSGWQNAQAHPAGQTYSHSCASIPNGIVIVGGFVPGTGYLKDVNLFRNGQWSIVGQMQHYQYFGTMIAYETFFIVFGGCDGHYSVERAEWDGNKVTSTEVINNHGGDCYNPIVFEAAPDQCKKFCSEDFCYVN